MKKTIFLQLIIFTVILIISTVVYKVYFSKKIINQSLNLEISDNNESQKPKSNLIHNIEYISQDNNGNSYILKSLLGEINFAKPELIEMKDVFATIKLKNSEIINIYSDEAIYNKINYDTNFYKNVLVTHKNNIIKSDNMNLLFNQNLATISNNVIYKNLNTELFADKIEIDLITKNSKIFMKNNSKKVKIVSMD
tara:strand:- start:957 stop:1541 length:585 start_codon:yes stop_codon:yes gene_type:complete